MRRTAQWKGDNVAEIERLMSAIVARADKQGDKLHIIGLGGLDVTLELGDSVILEGKRLGVRRARTDPPLQESYVTWQGDNVGQIAQFLGDYDLRIDVVGADLYLYGAEMVVLKRGDRVVRRDGLLLVSKAGAGHRI